MQELFSLDKKDYDPSWPVFSRHSVRGIIVRDGRVLLVFSRKYNYYKFPGGGIHDNENHAETLIREVLEETGRHVIPDSIREYGVVPRRHKSRFSEAEIFEQNNFFYFCDVDDNIDEQNLDEYEEDEEFTPVWTEPLAASAFNRSNWHGDADSVMIKRDSKILDMLDILLRKERRNEEENAWIDSLGKLCYREMLDYVSGRLLSCSQFNSSKDSINYSRFAHTKRVLGWALRLYRLSPVKEKLNYDVIVTAAIFHDCGYNDCNEFISHAAIGAQITREWLEQHGFDKEFTDRVCYLVENHSSKQMMDDPDISADLMLIMEADLLDDMGALGIVMDCIIEKGFNAGTTFEDCLDHIDRFTVRIQNDNPMRTPEGRALWDEKTRLVSSFRHALAVDIQGWSE